jgi:hypothetical protein
MSARPNAHIQCGLQPDMPAEAHGNCALAGGCFKFQARAAYYRRSNRRCAALTRCVQQLKGARLSAELARSALQLLIDPPNCR